MSWRVLALCFLLGAWCSASLFMWQVAVQNFAVAESVLASEEEGLRSATGDLPDERLRLVLRHQASEVNRLFFRIWGWVQIPLAVVVCALAWTGASGPGGPVMRCATGTMLAIVLVLAVYVVPETVLLGRAMDFLPAGELPESRSAFWVLHHTYTGLDLTKFALGLLAFARLGYRSRQASIQPG